MVTNFPRSIEAHDEPTFRQQPAAEGFGDRMMDRVREVFCGWHGHDNLLNFAHDRMFLKCVSCGHESPGWELNEAPPTPVARAERPLAANVRRQLVNERRIA